MNHLLLLGAGFSRNWGGWLATEVNDHLFTSPQIIADGYLQDLLHRYAATGGFEAALGECQTNYLQNPAEYRNHLENLQSAIDTMFLDMEAGFASKLPLQFSQELKFSVSRFLARFDTIFTLNQDLLLERHYLQSDVQTATPRIWNGWASPGMRPQSDPSTTDCRRVRWIPGQPSDFRVERSIQPYYKLHGSWNWWSADGTRMMILGGNKPAALAQHPVLEWYQRQFAASLSKPDTRLMVVGYGYGDRHINGVENER